MSGIFIGATQIKLKLYREEILIVNIELGFLFFEKFTSYTHKICRESKPILVARTTMDHYTRGRDFANYQKVINFQLFYWRKAR